ncbi:MAG TPA: DEAD/DEAH box helicase family protein [Acidimicrobiia bacterium]|nr:DEAD/DEAH box helicase family protein [Acidimicrobiia bacterium]
MTTPRDELLSQIAREEEHLASIDDQRERVKTRLETLRRQLASVSSTPTTTLREQVGPAAVPMTPADKVHLFRSLFRGRPDVYPTRFMSKKASRYGYAPACGNKFVPGVCELPRIRCGECPNQAFQLVDDQATLNHLQGRHVMGVYPLLEDDTCWLLAADFDKSTWREDVTAFAETCRSAGVSVSLERSQSGNGAHAWFFFTAAIPAGIARKMGCFLITETMARRHQLSMDSYDRLFPSQDTMPRGGFGNLIALPLQHEARKKGNTLFIDVDFNPIPDQWAYLASVERTAASTVEAIANEATRRDQVIGVRLAEPDDEVAAPWRRPPSGRPLHVAISGPLPQEVRGVISQRLFIEKTGLPSALLNRIKRVAAFQNPEFYKKQMMRLSTAGTPRVIACAEEFPEHIAVPRGCQHEIEQILREHGIAFVVKDERHSGARLRLRFHGELTLVQKRAAEALLQHDIGAFVAPPGLGKTVLATHLVATRGRNTLVLVHRSPLLDQWVAQLSMFLGIEESKIGRIGGGKRRGNGSLDVAMLQSLVRKGRVDDRVASYGHVIADECHHVPAISFERVLSEVKAKYILGLTATPHRRDGHHPILEMQLGPARFRVDPKSHAATRPFEHRLVLRETTFRLATSADVGIQAIYRLLAADEARNQMILDDVIQAVHEGRSPIVLTERRDHLDYLAERLHGFVRHLVVLRGGMTTKERAAANAALAKIGDEEERLVLATGRYIGEGFDDARLDTLFLAMPVSWKGTLAQYTGRLHRLHTGKTEVRIFDYVDRGVPMLLRMFDKRLRAYRALGYAWGDAPIDSAVSTPERTVEYDQELMKEGDSIS